MVSLIGLHKLADANFRVTQKTTLYYIIKLDQILYN